MQSNLVPFHLLFAPARLASALGVILLLVLAIGQSPASAAPLSSVKIGVLAFRGPVHTLNRWSPTAAYLNGAIADHRFEIIPLTLQEMSEAAQDGSVDFILTNSGNYVDLEARFGISRIATLRTPEAVQAGNLFGAILFTSAKKSQGVGAIRTINDLRGRSFMAVNQNGFGGFQMGWRELQAKGVNPFDDFQSLTFAGFPQDEIIYAVLEGRVDAGTVRTGTLENMQAEGKIKLSDFHILNRRTYPGFPYLVSTRLYPEWPFARVKSTSEVLSQKVAIALLSMPSDHSAALAGRYAGWAVPGDYQGVHELFRELRIGPYAEFGRLTFTAFLSSHWEWFVFALVLVLITIVWATHTESVVAERTRALSDANAELETQIAERRRAEAETRRRENELAHVWRLSTMGEMATSLAHEINQPLSAISNYARGCARRLEGPDVDNKALVDAMNQIARQAERAGNIISRIRTFLRKEEPERVPVNINNVMRETIDMLTNDAKSHGVQIRQYLTASTAQVVGDTVQIQQVIVNLMRNGCESMSDTDADNRILWVSAVETENGNVEIAVRDNGTGIPDKDRDHLFDPFFTTKENGLGMGLSISRSIIESHGGRLSVETPPEGGTLFTVRLPIERRASNRNDKESSDAA